MKCENCKGRKIIAGQAFTNYICGHCFRVHSHRNTAVPNLCRECSERTQRCEDCLQGLHEEICKNCKKIKGMCRCVNSTLIENDN